MDWMSLLGLASQVAGSYAGSKKQDDSQAQASAILQRLIDQYNGMSTPDLQNVAPATVKGTAFDNISEDPAAGQAYAESDAALKNVADSGGLDVASMAALNKVQNQINSNNSAQQQAITDSFQRRGQLGSGAQLLAALHGQQQAAQQGNEQGMQTLGDARRRALQAIVDRGSQAQSRSNSVYNRQSQAAQAKDAMAKYNAEATRQAGVYGNTVKQGNFQNQQELAKGRAGAYGTMANYYTDQGDRAAYKYSKMGEAGSQAVNALGSGTKKKPTDEEDNGDIWV